MVRLRRADRGGESSNGESDEERRKRVIRNALEQHRDEDPARQADAVQEAMLAEPSPETTDWLWKAFIGGLIALLLLALCGVIALGVLGKSNQALVTIFASILSGLLGLFIRGPAEGPS